MKIIHVVNDFAERLLQPVFETALRSFPVVVLTGARQTGKSTLVRALAARAGRPYLSLDDFEVLERARSQPEELVASSPALVLDEVQRAPDLLIAVKRAVDADRRPGRFVLTGSANLLLLKSISETLAGRAVYLTLWPFSRREQLGSPRAGLWSELFETPSRDWSELLLAVESAGEDWRGLASRGGYPVPAHQLSTPEQRAMWFAGYAKSYLERDVQDLANVASLVDFRRLMRAVALRLGNLVNQTELARDVGLSQPTVHRHLGVLEASYQLVRLPPYAVNRTKRLIKAPKAYWADTGLALSLAGETEPRGAHLENIVLQDLLAWSASLLDGPQLLFWRTTTGEEVDLVVEWRGKLLPIEVKTTPRPRLRDASGLQAFRAEYPDAMPGLLLHTGEELGWVTEGVLAAPWWRVV